MGNRILVAVDDSKNSLKAIRYVAENMRPDSQITLLSILPDPVAGCELQGPSLTPIFEKNKQAFCAMEDTKKDRVKAFMSEARTRLLKAGFPPECIGVRVRKKKKGIARDILKEVREGKYETLVVGRRGHSSIREFFMGSVSNKLLHQASNMAVVVVD